MSNHDHGHQGGGFGNGLFLGILVGVGLAIFLRTREGQKIKRQLFSSGEGMIDELGEKVIEFLEDGEVRRR